MCHTRGLRQGELLSPLLFILTMKMLNALFQCAGARALFASLRSSTIQHRVSLYTDDLILFIVPIKHDIRLVCAIMEVFTSTSSLHTNISKCQFTPIQPLEEQVELVPQLLPCQLVYFSSRIEKLN
jgi:hypothetical protein